MSATLPRRTSRSGGPRVRVLIGEHDPGTASVLVTRVRALGHVPVGPFDDGAVALATALIDPPDAYVLTGRLPGIDGVALVRRLREHGLRGPVVLLGGDASVSAEAGISDVLSTPVDLGALDAALDRATSRDGRYADHVAQLPQAGRAGRWR